MRPRPLAAHRLLTALSLVIAVSMGVACTAVDDERDPGETGGLPPEALDDIERVVEDAAGEQGWGALAYVDTPTGAVAVADGLPEGAEQDVAGAAFRVASVTKLVTSAVVLQLVEEGALALDDPVEGVLPERMETLESGDEITVRHLLAHTSGLPDYLRNPDFVAELLSRADIGGSQVTAACADLADIDPITFVAGEASFAPGSDWQYSNAGYYLAGEVIEEVAGMPLEAVYRERVLDPLGLSMTWLQCEEEPRAELLPGYHAPGSFGITVPGQGDGPVEVTAVEDPTMWAAGGLVSTPAEVAALARALFGGGLFDDEATLEEMLETGQEPTYGLGVRVREGLVGHDGLAPGYGTHLHYDPEADTAVVVVINETATELPRETGERIHEILADHDDAG